MYVYCFEVKISTIKSKPSILHLELQAAVIATILKYTLVNEIPMEKRNTFLWAHSKIVLNYHNNNNTNFEIRQ